MEIPQLINNQLFLNEDLIEIPRIKLLEILGKGANALVLRGYDELLDRYVAVKIWLPRKGFSYPDKNRFFAEIRKVSPLNRPQIVQIFDANIIADKYCYAILELVDGITLRDWLLKKQECRQRYEIAQKVLYELVYLHKLGIFHGDLHDRNILIKNTGEVKILDFGTSIFSINAEPHKREKHVLLDTCLKVLNEESFYQFLDKSSLLKYPSECAPYALIALTRILGFFQDYYENEDKGSESKDTWGEKKLVFLCACWIKSIPFFDIRRFIEAFIELGLGIDYIIYFFSITFSLCNNQLNGSISAKTEPKDINEDNIENFLKIYSTLRDQFINSVIEGKMEI